MPDIWVISDTHFNHHNIIHKFGSRPEFSSVEEMNEVIIERWNENVKPNDKVYHLGDVFFGNKNDYVKDIHPRLNGRKRLIIGNHDDVKYLTPHFEKIMMWRQWHDFGLVFTHVPIHPTTLEESRFGDKFGTVRNVHGHIHTKPSPVGNYRCVCVEQIGYRPINIEELRQ